jgi:hypothetical protein
MSSRTTPTAVQGPCRSGNSSTPDRAREKPSGRKNREKSEAIRRARKTARKKVQREGILPPPKRKLMNDCRATIRVRAERQMTGAPVDRAWLALVVATAAAWGRVRRGFDLATALRNRAQIAGRKIKPRGRPAIPASKSHIQSIALLITAERSSTRLFADIVKEDAFRCAPRQII